jgi:RNA polymerase sigma-B factor
MSSTHDDQSISHLLVGSRSAPPGDRARAEGEVVAFFQPMTHALAHRYVRRGVEADDLDQVADLALLKAMRRFDPASGHLRGFVTATVLGEIKKHFRDHAWMVRPPRHIQDLQSAVMDAEADITPDGSGMTRSARVAVILGIDRSVISEVLVARSGFRALSLDWDADHEGVRFVDQLVERRRTAAPAPSVRRGAQPDADRDATAVLAEAGVASLGADPVLVAAPSLVGCCVTV